VPDWDQERLLTVATYRLRGRRPFAETFVRMAARQHGDRAAVLRPTGIVVTARDGRSCIADSMNFEAGMRGQRDVLRGFRRRAPSANYTRGSHARRHGLRRSHYTGHIAAASSPVWRGSCAVWFKSLESLSKNIRSPTLTAKSCGLRVLLGRHHSGRERGIIGRGLGAGRDRKGAREARPRIPFRRSVGESSSTLLL